MVVRFSFQAHDPNHTQTRAVHSSTSMACRFCISLSFFVIAASSHSGLHGTNDGLYGGVVASSQYTLNLQPPEENTHDVEASLDAMMKAENEKSILSDTEFAAAKQRLINVEKQRIQDIVREAFESV